MCHTFVITLFKHVLCYLHLAKTNYAQTQIIEKKFLSIYCAMFQTNLSAVVA